MASINVQFSGAWNAADFDFNKDTAHNNLLRLQRFLQGLQTGAYSATYQTIASSTDAVAASSDVTATTSGNLGTVINGTTVTTSFTTSQDGTATQAVADINANATVNKWVRATKGATGHFTVTALVPGAIGNCVTLTVTGTGASATGSGKLASGAGVDGTAASFSLA